MKSLFKLGAVLVLAVFQLSFFLSPQTEKNIYRDLAQSDEVATDIEVEGRGNVIRTNGRVIDPSFLEEVEAYDNPVFTDESEEGDGDEELAEESDEDSSFEDLIPENMPPAEDVRQALINYKTRKEECLVREEDRSRMNRLLESYNDAKSSGSSEDKALAFYELANKLIDIGLLDHEFERPSSSSSSDDDSRYDIDTDDLETEKASTSGKGLLDLNVNSDLAQFKECHIAIMRDRNMTEEEQKAYYNNTILPIQQARLRDGLESTPETIRDANNWYTVAQQADAVTGNQLGLQYGAQAHGQAAIAISAQLAEITRLQNLLKLNPADQATRTLLATKFTEIETSLRGISTNLKAQASTALVADPEAKASAEANIDFAINYWAQETINIANGESSNILTPSVTTSPTVANPILPAAVGAIPTVFTDSNTLGAPTANLDPNNPMLLPPTATLNGSPVAGIRSVDDLIRGPVPVGSLPGSRNRPIRQ